MNKKMKIFAGIISLVTVIFVCVFFLIKFMWSWVVPDLFPGAVESGLVASEISWFTALKLALFMAILGGGIKFNNNKK